MRGFFVFLGVVLLLGATWNKMVVKEGLVARLDAKPKTAGAAGQLFVLARYYDFLDRPKKALPIYQRIVDRYPDSPHGLDALHGLASALEKTKDYKQSLKEYQRFLEKYPGSKYEVSVRNNVDILKSL